MLVIRIAFYLLLVLDSAYGEEAPEGLMCIYVEESLRPTSNKASLYNFKTNKFVHSATNNFTLNATNKELVLHFDGKDYAYNLSERDEHLSLKELINKVPNYSPIIYPNLENIIRQQHVNGHIIFKQTVLISNKSELIYLKNKEPVKLTQNLHFLELNTHTMALKNLSRPNDSITYHLQEFIFNNEECKILLYQYENNSNEQIFYSVFARFVSEPATCFQKLKSYEADLTESEMSEILESVYNNSECVLMINLTNNSLAKFDEIGHFKSIKIKNRSIKIYVQGFGAKIFYRNRIDSNFFFQF